MPSKKPAKKAAPKKAAIKAAKKPAIKKDKAPTSIGIPGYGRRAAK